MAGAAPGLTPVVRARLAAIDGTPVTRELVERRRREAAEKTWYFTREYVLTWAAAPPAANAITRGRWWTAAEAGGAAARSPWRTRRRASFGVGVGGTLTFDVQGVPIEAEVMSLRKVDWQSLTTNFFVIFSPGALDGAPVTYVATARVPAGGRDRPCRTASWPRFPNVTAIPVRDVLERVAGLLGQIAFAVRVIALFSIGAGLVVMVGALAATRYQRLYESVILRTLGATRGVGRAGVRGRVRVPGRGGRASAEPRSPRPARLGRAATSSSRHPGRSRPDAAMLGRRPHDGGVGGGRLPGDVPPARPEAADRSPPGVIDMHAADNHGRTRPCSRRSASTTSCCVFATRRPRRFYTECSAARSITSTSASRSMQLRFGDQLIDLLPATKAGTGPGAGMDHVCLSIRCDDLKAVAEALRRRRRGRGGRGRALRGAWGDGPSLYLRDPDGYMIELKPRP